jgi:hypothetical protein
VVTTPTGRDSTVAISAPHLALCYLLKYPAQRDMTTGYQALDGCDLSVSNVVKVQDDGIGFAAVDAGMGSQVLVDG